MRRSAATSGRAGAAVDAEGKRVDETERGDGGDAGRQGSGRGEARRRGAGDVAYGGADATGDGDGAVISGDGVASGPDEAAWAGGVAASAGDAGEVGAVSGRDVPAAPSGRDVPGAVTTRETAEGGAGDGDGGDASASAVRDGVGSFQAPASWPAPLPGTRSPDVAPPLNAPGASDAVAAWPVGGRGDASPGRGGDVVPEIPTSPEGPGWAAFGYPLAHAAFRGLPQAGYAPSPYVASSPVPPTSAARPATAAPHATYGAPVAAPAAPSTAPFPPQAASSAPHVAVSGALPRAAGPARAALSLGGVALLAYVLAATLDAGGAVAFWFLGLVTGVLAVVFGAVGAGRARRAGGPGRGMSLAGLVCGLVGLAGGLAVLVVGFVLAVEEGEGADGGRTYGYHVQAPFGVVDGPHAASR